MTPERFVERWSGSGGAEIANSQSFVIDLCDLLSVPRPNPAGPLEADNDYVFEKGVVHEERGRRTTVRIDLYNKGKFVLEAKQGSDETGRPATPSERERDSGRVRGGMARRGTSGWERAMRAAYGQAKGYVADLPPDHPVPPFLVVVDVGHRIETFADFSGTGRNYTQFPDRSSYSIPLEGLLDADVRERLRAIWTDPKSLDPAPAAAAVTSQISERLAKIARVLEGRTRSRGTGPTYDPADVAAFLMRCTFSMFAEDVGLLPPRSFTELLESLVDRPADFVPAIEAFWSVMDKGGWEARTSTVLRRFNGSLFFGARALPLDRQAIHDLAAAARQDWAGVEPAIFGTLLERALDPKERSSLGAHYTPRTYVERLVIPTVIEPLREDWSDAQGEIERLARRGDVDRALDVAVSFHRQLCRTRVLDPACGTGNFLYVAMELIKRLESEVLDAIQGLGDTQDVLAIEGETVEPSRFLGLEKNPRAVAIADLVLWVGYLRWQIRNGGLQAVPEPVLRKTGNILEQDAVITWDVTQTGDGDPEGQEVPARAEWPEAEFIVGNPPFIGGGQMRAELGDGYAEAVWKARPKVPAKADFVMQWWDEAAERLARKGTKKSPNPLRRFGFITTNSITQTFSRRVVERHLGGKVPVSLAFAVPDHPWVKSDKSAAVRIAMTVVRPGNREGALGEVTAERDLNTDAPVVELRQDEGSITAKLTLGADTTKAVPLLANETLSSNGMLLAGKGFKVSAERAATLAASEGTGVQEHLRPYRSGSDLTRRPKGTKVIDLYPLSVNEARDRFPALYQHLVDNVRPHREGKRGGTADANEYADNWWKFAKVRAGLRNAISDLPRYIATTETTKHRFFQFLDADVRPDHMVVAIGLDRADALAVLSSRPHVLYAIAAGGWLGAGNDPRYSKSRTFDPFPFPTVLTDPSPDAPTLASRDRLRELGERLEAHRRERLDAHDDLTMTGLYNRLETFRTLNAGGKEADEVQRADFARVGTEELASLHDDIDRAVLEVYGWSDLAGGLIGKPGGTTPSIHKTESQERVEDILLTRLVDLNAERRAKERAGTVDWLRPSYQVPKLGRRVPSGSEEEQASMEMEIPDGGHPWPGKDGRAQFPAVRGVLSEATSPLTATAVSKTFKGRASTTRTKRVEEILDIMVDLGVARATERDGAVTYAERG